MSASRSAPRPPRTLDVPPPRAERLVIHPAVQVLPIGDIIELRYDTARYTVPATGLWRTLTAGHAVMPTTPADIALCAQLLVAGLVWQEDKLLALLAHTDARLALALAAGSPRGAQAEGPRGSAARRRHTRVELSGLASLVTPLADVLAECGLSIGSTGADLRVVIGFGGHDTWTLQRLSNLEQPHLPVVVRPERVYLGPLVVPGQTPCWECALADRALGKALRAPLPMAAEHARLWEPQTVLIEPSLWQWALGMVAREVTAYADGVRPQTWSHVVGHSLLGPLGPHRVRAANECSCSWPVPAPMRQGATPVA